MIPQDNCNQSDIRWASVTNSEGIGLLMSGAKPMNFSAYPYDDADITKARHLNELDEADFVTVNYDDLVTGLGTATCGPGILPQYVANSGIYRFEVSYRPVEFQQKNIFAYVTEKYETSELLIAQAPVLRRNDDGKISISGNTDETIYYTVNDGKPKKYSNPFDLKKGGKVTAYAEVAGKTKSTSVSEIFEISKEKWTAKADCSYPGEGPESAIDNRAETIWHSDWEDDNCVQPHFVEVDMKELLEVKGFYYLPRQDGSNGRIASYNFEVSADGKKWETIVEKGRFWNYEGRQEKMFDNPVKMRYFKITTLREVSNSAYSSIAEIGVVL